MRNIIETISFEIWRSREDEICETNRMSLNKKNNHLKNILTDLDQCNVLRIEK